MPEESFQEKTEKATPKKREKVREEGQVAKSMELPSVLILMAAIIVLYIFGYYSYQNLTGLLRYSFTFDSIPNLDLKHGIFLMNKHTIQMILILAPLMVAVFLAALVANFFQVGFYVSFKAVEPKLNKLDIIKGFGRLFSMRSLVELTKSIVKLCIIGVIAYFVVKGEANRMLGMHDASVAYFLLFILKGIMKIFFWVILAMSAMAVLDYGFQKWQFEKQIMMTKQEVKDESKQMEGDPQVKSRIRSIQYQAARKRMMQAVPEADVVVTNPTHLAIAIHYESGSMNAPKVTAKGAGLLAERIKKIARENHIPVIENKELARNLYKLVDIGQNIPLQLYRAVAELLAFVYKLKGKSI
ncbi:MAG TPA: flagellar biosynthesis protein FlhB [Desulfobacterales bacterium]|nr:flagellar biosynthesis protein FlhB [Desulfobacterales bacterium]